jgi:hypothetical protein
MSMFAQRHGHLEADPQNQEDQPAGRESQEDKRTTSNNTLQQMHRCSDSLTHQLVVSYSQALLGWTDANVFGRLCRHFARFN